MTDKVEKPYLVCRKPRFKMAHTRPHRSIILFAGGVRYTFPIYLFKKLVRGETKFIYPQTCSSFNRKFWKDEEIQWLIENYPKYKQKDLAVKLDRTLNAVCEKIRELQADGKLTFQKPHPPFRIWNAEEKKYLIDNYQTKSVLEIAQHLGRSRDSVLVKLGRYKQFMKKRVNSLDKNGKDNEEL